MAIPQKCGPNGPPLPLPPPPPLPPLPPPSPREASGAPAAAFDGGRAGAAAADGIGAITAMLPAAPNISKHIKTYQTITTHSSPLLVSYGISSSLSSPFVHTTRPDIVHNHGIHDCPPTPPLFGRMLSITLASRSSTHTHTHVCNHTHTCVCACRRRILGLKVEMSAVTYCLS